MYYFLGLFYYEQEKMSSTTTLLHYSFILLPYRFSKASIVSQ